MKILFLYYSPWWNATAYYSVTLAQGLQDAGHEVWFGTDKNMPAAQKANEKDLRIFDIKLQTVNPIKTTIEITRLVRLVKKEKIDIVNAVSPPGHLFHFFGSILFGLKVPLVRTCCDARKPKNNWFNKQLYSQWVDWLIFPCKANFERYYKVLKMPPQKTSVVYAGIDVTAFDNRKPENRVTEPIKTDKNQKIVGIVGRLSPEKGHRHFLHVAAKVAARVKNVRFVIVGQEFQVKIDSLSQLAESLGIANSVHFTGYVEHARAAIDEFTIGVITSRFSETIARVALEYMTARKPVIATNVNVLEEIIKHEKTGMVFEVDDIIGMAEQITALLNDESKCREWGQSARAEVEELYTIESITEKTVTVYNKVLNGRKADN